MLGNKHHYYKPLFTEKKKKIMFLTSMGLLFIIAIRRLLDSAALRMPKSKKRSSGFGGKIKYWEKNKCNSLLSNLKAVHKIKHT